MSLYRKLAAVMVIGPRAIRSMVAALVDQELADTRYALRTAEYELRDADKQLRETEQRLDAAQNEIRNLEQMLSEAREMLDGRT